MSYGYSCCILLGTTDANKHKTFKDNDCYDLWTELPCRASLFELDDVTIAEASDCFCWMAEPAPHYYWMIRGEFHNVMPITDILLRLRLAHQDGWHYAIDYQGENEWEPMVRGEDYTSTRIVNGVGQQLYHRYNPENRKRQKEVDERMAKARASEDLKDQF